MSISSNPPSAGDGAPDPRREAFILHRFEGLSLDETSLRLGANPDSVAQWIHSFEIDAVANSDLLWSAEREFLRARAPALTVCCLARRMGRSVGYVERRLARLGLQAAQRVRWTRESLIEALRQEVEAGGIPTTHSHEDLYQSARKLSLHWSDLLRAAGCEPPERSRRKWNRETLLAELRRRFEQSLTLQRRSVALEDRALVEAVSRVLGSWKEAVYEATGIEYADLPRTQDVVYRRASRTWTREAVILEIQDRAARELSLRASDVTREDAALMNAAIRHLSRWSAAVGEAGFDYDEIRANKRAWNRDEILNGIRSRAREGKSLRREDVVREDPSLQVAADRYCGGWLEAVRSAGLEESAIMSRRVWNEETVVNEIRSRAGRSLSLARPVVAREDPTLVRAAERHYSDWSGALSVAGFQDDGVEPVEPPDADREHGRQLVISAIRALAEAGEHLSSSRVFAQRRDLFNSAIRAFGSWTKARKAAGLAARLGHEPRWKESVVREKILKRYRAGLHLGSNRARREDPNLFAHASRIFRGWYRALVACGIDPTPWRKRGPHRPQ